MAASSWREPKPTDALVWVRCRYCRRGLFKTDASSGRFEIVCPKCKAIQTQQLGARD